MEQADVSRVMRDIGKEDEVAGADSRLPEEDVSNFCLWLKEACGGKISKVKISNRLKSAPGLVAGSMSSSMYMMMQMMQAQQGMDPSKMGNQQQDLTLEINPNHPTIINMNTVRKAEPEFAREIAAVFLNSTMMSSNIPFDLQAGASHQYTMLTSYLEEAIDSLDSSKRKSKPIQEAEIITDDEPQMEESILKQAKAGKKTGRGGKKMSMEYTVTGEEGKK